MIAVTVGAEQLDVLRYVKFRYSLVSGVYAVMRLHFLMALKVSPTGRALSALFFEYTFTGGGGDGHISFPHTSHPSVRCRANNSIRGKSPTNSTIFLLIMGGFLL